ncbi:MAG TPA: hypothetical protein EYP14_09995 [Planctomycetaceae bacterium]|nr:hypothetical protein [Planctomycetaceae bacterium]
MNETMSVELTDQQREILLKGLRYVRSSIMLEIQEPSSERAQQRAEKLEQINALVQQLSGGVRRSPAQVR